MDALVLRDSITGNMTDDEFLKFCLENPTLRIERNSDLEVVIMSPVSTLSGLYSSEIEGQLFMWNRLYDKGVVFDSSVGFTLPDRSVLSPDASWLSRKKWDSLDQEEKNRFAPICPEFVIEVVSKSDELGYLRKKMALWIKNGAQLAWLIDPWNETAYWYQEDYEKIIKYNLLQKLTAIEPVSGFELDLSRLKS